LPVVVGIGLVREMHGERLPPAVTRHYLESDPFPRNEYFRFVVIEYGRMQKYIFAAIVGSDKSVSAHRVEL
jgi:hypothetical protein